MAQRLNRTTYLLLAALCLLRPAMAQDERQSDKDYKDKTQFEKFTQRRKTVAAWQIGQLKEGALVVRLRTNSLLETALIKQGNLELAAEKHLETQGINMNIMRAYLNYYNFSKVYFIYSSSSDSLLRGVRSNIFLDTSLKVNPSIVMTEKFYLLAERDYSYNSSIGFVPEDSARAQVEKGNAVKEMAVVVKNKYGHQLKKPFPYEISDVFNIKMKSDYVVYVTIQGVSVPFNVSVGRRSGGDGGSNDKKYVYEGKPISLYMPKYLTYARLALIINRFNDQLYEYYKYNPHTESAWIDASIRPFLY